MPGDRKTYCGDCGYWTPKEEESKERKRGYGECNKDGGSYSKFIDEYCYEGTNSY